MEQNNETTEKTVEDEVREYEERTGIHLDAHSKATLRDMIKRDNKFFEREARDYVYGQDEGEPPKGANW